jgi:hypothetical protein
LEKFMKALLFCLSFSVLTSQAATIYNLRNDFSNTANPNSAWSYTQGNSTLPSRVQPTDGNSLNPAAANGFFGVGTNFQTAPFIIQTSQNGAATSPYSNNDFLVGDIIAHSTNPGSGANFFINWTAPSSGTIDFSGAVWYAHSPVHRSEDYFVTLNSASLASATVAWNNGQIRPTPSTFAYGGALSVVAGDVLALSLVPTTGETFGSLAGVNFTVTLTPRVPAATPEPGTELLLAAGLLGVAALKFRRS